MPRYKLRCPSKVELLKKTSMETLEMIIDIFNLGGFSFGPVKARPDIQVFIDKHPDLVQDTLVEEKEDATD